MPMFTVRIIYAKNCAFATKLLICNFDQISLEIIWFSAAWEEFNPI